MYLFHVYSIFVPALNVPDVKHMDLWTTFSPAVLAIAPVELLPAKSASFKSKVGLLIRKLV
jgi:hypothetical protein